MSTMICSVNFLIKVLLKYLLNLREVNVLARGHTAA